MTVGTSYSVNLVRERKKKGGKKRREVKKRKEKKEMGVGRSKIKCILLFDEAAERLPADERKRVEVAFLTSTEKEDLSGKMKKATFLKCVLLYDRHILIEVNGRRAYLM
jgi:hypothetical protein